MNGKPNVEPPWMSLKRLVETRMFDILRKEQGNRKYIRLYGAGEYWHAFEESAFQLSRIFTEYETTLFSHKDHPFPVVMARSRTTSCGLTSGSIFRFATGAITSNCWLWSSPPRNTVHGMNTR